MCNCGKRRNEYSHSINPVNVNTKKDATPKDTGHVRFKYIGKTALTAIGSITRKQYRFNFPGDEQHVDYQDTQSMMTIKVLKKIDE